MHNSLREVKELMSCKRRLVNLSRTMQRLLLVIIPKETNFLILLWEVISIEIYHLLVNMTYIVSGASDCNIGWKAYPWQSQ